MKTTKKTTTRRLVLSPETLANLTQRQLSAVAGGQTRGTCTLDIDFCGTLHTQFNEGCDGTTKECNF